MPSNPAILRGVKWLGKALLGGRRPLNHLGDFFNVNTLTHYSQRFGPFQGGSKSRYIDISITNSSAAQAQGLGSNPHATTCWASNIGQAKGGDQPTSSIQTCDMTLHNELNIFEPQFPFLKNGTNNSCTWVPLNIFYMQEECLFVTKPPENSLISVCKCVSICVCTPNGVTHTALPSGQERVSAVCVSPLSYHIPTKRQIQVFFCIKQHLCLASHMSLLCWHHLHGHTTCHQ